MSSSVSDECGQKKQGGNLLRLLWEMSEYLAHLLNTLDGGEGDTFLQTLPKPWMFLVK